jgi:hypothetical protein
VTVLEGDWTEGVWGASGFIFWEKDNVCAVYACSVGVVVIEVVEKSVEGVLDNGPVGPIEAGPKAIRARACISVHLMKGIEDFLLGEGIVEVS